MIGRLFFVFFILLASVYLGIQLQSDAGYILIAYKQWTVETTLWVGIVFTLILFFCIHFLFTLLSKIWHFPQTWRHWKAKYRAKKAQEKTRQGLIEFSEGYWQQAKKHLIKALPDAETPLLNYLTAARAAQEMGDSQLRDDYLRQAQQSMPEAKIAVELTQAQLQLAHQQWEQALATLRHLQTLAPYHPYVLKLLMHLYEQVRDWPQLLHLLPELKKQQVISKERFDHLQKRTYIHAMSDASKQNNQLSIEQLYSELPRSLKYDPEINAVYARYLLKNHQDKKAESLLQRCLHKQFNETLITIYGQLEAEVAQLEFVTSFLKHHPHSTALLLCLGRISQKKSLWGRARHYFEDCIELGPTSEAYAELGELLDSLHEENAACQAFKKGLQLAISAQKRAD